MKTKSVYLAVIGICIFLQSATGATKAEFEKLMQGVAEGWNENNARKAADCFAEDAVYLDPPDKQIYRNREELFKFFGGKEGRKEPMKMIWHHLTFNEATEIGSGEFTFEYGSISHGVVVVRIRNGKIQNWREYYYETPLKWEDFIKLNPF
jgi:nuclear transport factor 2 (NTF2) superfamily protein